MSADLNQDGKADIVTASFFSGTANSVAVADINSDGRLTKRS